MREREIFVTSIEWQQVFSKITLSIILSQVKESHNLEKQFGITMLRMLYRSGELNRT